MLCSSLLRYVLPVALGLLSQQAISQEALRIGAEDDWFPYTAYRDGKIQGMSVDIVKAAFAAANTPIELVHYPYTRCMQLARSGQLAGCFNTTPNPRIASEYLIPSEPLFEDDILLWAKNTNTPIDADVQHLAGRRVAMTIGYEYGPLLDDNPQVMRVPVPRDLSGFLMLQHGRVDYVAAFRGTALALFKEKPALAGQFVAVGAVHRAHLYLSLSREHPGAQQLLERFDQGMRTIHSNGRYQRILQHWGHDTAAAKVQRLDYTPAAQPSDLLQSPTE